MRQPCVYCGARRQILRVALGRAGVDPARDRRLLRVGQAALVREVADRRIGMPRRHDAGLDRVGNRARPRPRILVGEQRHRRDLARPMTGGAVGKEDRRDVIKGGPTGLCLREGWRSRNEPPSSDESGTGESNSHRQTFYCGLGRGEFTGRPERSGEFLARLPELPTLPVDAVGIHREAREVGRFV